MGIRKLLDFFASLPACLVGIEASPTAYYWSRRLRRSSAASAGDFVATNRIDGRVTASQIAALG
jgi:transposase